MAATLYGNGVKNMCNGTVDYDTDTIKMALTTSSYTPNQDTHEFFDDVTNEVVGTGYTADGATIGTKAITVDTTNDQVEFDCADITWSSSTITARYGVLYKDTGTASTSPLIAYFDFGADKSSSGGDFTLTVDAEGLFKISY